MPPDITADISFMVPSILACISYLIFSSSDRYNILNEGASTESLSAFAKSLVSDTSRKNRPKLAEAAVYPRRLPIITEATVNSAISRGEITRLSLSPYIFISLL